MFYLRSSAEGNLYYLFNRENLTIGRKNCDISVSSDQSASRKHAEIIVKDKIPYIKDCGSKYGTFKNGKKLTNDETVALSPNDEIRIGVLNSLFIFTQVRFNTTASNIPKPEKQVLMKNLNKLQGKLYQNWSANCTSVTVLKVVLTPKVLCALITGIPIVSLNYWDKVLECISKDQPLPDPKDYRPESGEQILSTNQYSLDFNSMRKKLFQDKIFVFFNQDFKMKMEDVITLAGGSSMCFSSNPITMDTIKNSKSEYIFIHDEAALKSTSTSVNSIISYLKNTNQRTIPLQEIALALLQCSCERDCNPKFPRTQLLLSANTDAHKESGDQLLVLDTQQDVQVKEEMEVKTDVVIPPTLEADVDMEVVEVVETENRKRTASCTDEKENVKVKKEDGQKNVRDAKPKQTQLDFFLKKKPITGSEQNVRAEHRSPPRSSSTQFRNPFLPQKSNSSPINKNVTSEVNIEVVKDSPFNRTIKSSSTQKKREPSVDEEDPAQIFKKPKTTSENQGTGDKKRKNSASTSQNTFPSALLPVKKEGDIPSRTATLTGYFKPSFDFSDVLRENKKYKWFSKSADKSKSDNSSIRNSTYWEGTNELISDCVVVRRKKLSLPHKPPISVQEIGNLEKKVNHKKFCKAPVKNQSKIISSSAFKKIYVNHVGET